MNDYEKLLIKIKKQKHQLRILINKTTYYKQEIERLNNIVNELEKCIANKMNSFGVCNASDIYYKLQELKGSDKE